MRMPTVLVYEKDGRLAEQLRREPACSDWSVREPRRWESCRKLLSRGGPRIVVLRVGADLVKEFSLLERLASIFPEVPCVVVGDSEHAALAGIAGDLGAMLSLFPPLPRNLLGPVVESLMRSQIPQAASVVEEADESEGGDG